MVLSRNLKKLALAFAVVFPAIGFAGPSFPMGPDSHMTPGSLCSNPSEYRYPEHIPYCNRDVETAAKREIIADYDHRLGFSIQQMDRQEFKIDHFIPLCAGGSNSTDNLWPQHRSIYQQTDPIEPLLCQKMSEGKLLQKDAVELVRKAKLDLSKVDEVMETLSNL